MKNWVASTAVSSAMFAGLAVIYFHHKITWFAILYVVVIFVFITFAFTGLLNLMEED